MSPVRVKGRAWLLARVILTAVMLAILLPRLRSTALFPDHHVRTLLLMAGAVVVTMGTVVLSTIRWQQMLHALELPATLTRLLSHTLAGSFVSNFLPTTVGGDVLRASRLAAENGNRKVSAASVVLERLIGFMSLPLIALVGLMLNPSLLRLGTASKLALALTLGPLAALSVFLVVAVHPRLGDRLGARRWLRLAMTVHLGLVRLRRHPALAFSVVLAAVAYQLATILAAWMTAHAMGISLSWTEMMAFMPVVAIAQALPLSIGGLGLREGSLVLLLGPLGVADSQAVAFGLLLYGLSMAISLLGAPAFLVGSRRAPVPTLPPSATGGSQPSDPSGSAATLGSR